MTASDDIKMTINIGDERISLIVPFNMQDNVRDAEKWANNAYTEMKKKFPSRVPSNILARVVYQLSAIILEQNDILNKALAAANNCDRQLKVVTEKISNI